MFQNLKNNTSVQAFKSFLKKKVRGISNTVRNSRMSRWAKGVKSKKRKDYHSPINQLRRQQTSHWEEGGKYASRTERRSKKVLKEKLEGRGQR